MAVPFSTRPSPGAGTPYASPSTLVVRISGGWVDEDGWSRDTRGEPLVLEDGCATLPLPNRSASRPTSSRAISIPGSVVVITSKWSYKYFHWMVEAMPRLSLAHAELRNGAKLLTSCKGGVPAQSLELIGLRRSSLICHKKGRAYFPETLLWTEPSPCGGVRRAATTLFRSRLLLPAWRAPASAPPAGKVVLYQRHKHRRLLAHGTVLAALRRSYGTADVTVEDGSSGLRRQVELFRTARCQVGPHGAALALMIFAPASFGTGEVTPGAYFVSIRGKPSGPHGAGSAGVVVPTTRHLNRNRNRTGHGVHSPEPNRCFRGLAETLGQRHAWLLVDGAAANDDLAPQPDAVLALAQSTDVCGPSQASMPQVAS